VFVRAVRGVRVIARTLHGRGVAAPPQMHAPCAFAIGLAVGT
jgi:hypothetical protein